MVPGEPAIEPPDVPDLRPRVSAAASTARARGGAPDDTPDRAVQRRAVLLALVAAVGIGLMLLGYDETAKHDALWALLGGRISSACFFTVILLALRPRIGMRRSALPGIVAVGILDTSANGLFALATTQGFLSLVAVLGSLYPVVTVVLAYLVLRERLARHQIVRGDRRAGRGSPHSGALSRAPVYSLAASPKNRGSSSRLAASSASSSGSATS